MDKTASMRLTQLVAINMGNVPMHKQADFKEVVNNIKDHLRRNALTYTGGAVGAGLGAVSAIGGPWWKYLTNSAVGGAAGAGLGHVGDRLRNQAQLEADNQRTIADATINENKKLDQLIKDLGYQIMVKDSEIQMLSDKYGEQSKQVQDLIAERDQLSKDLNMVTDESNKYFNDSQDKQKIIDRLHNSLQNEQAISAALGVANGADLPSDYLPTAVIPSPLDRPTTRASKYSVYPGKTL